jgi:hypothetical protein
MKRHLVRSALLIGVLVWAASCRAGTLPPAHVATRVAVLAQEVDATATAVWGEIAARTSLPPELKPPAEAREAVRLAIEDLVKKLGVPASTIRLLRVETVEWSDTSLGCPKEGMMYAQVITPGFRVVLWAQEREYQYHTDAGRFVVLCEK